MVVGQCVAVLVYRTAQDSVGKRIPLCFDLPSSGDEIVSLLGCYYGVEHNGKITAGGIFHANGNIQSAYHEAVFLIFHGAGADGHVGEQIGQVVIIIRVEHLVRGTKARLLQRTDMHMADRQNTCQYIWFCLRVRLMEHAFVTLTGGTRFVGIDTGNQHQAVLHFVLKLGKAVGVITYRIFIVCGTGADDDKKLVRSTGDDIADHFISFSFYLFQLFGHRCLRFDLVRRGKLFYEFEAHSYLLCLTF